MGASADQIDREIKETRERMDQNLGVLEDRAASNAVRYGRIAAVIGGVAAAGVAALLIYRRFRKPSLKDRLHSLSPDGLGELAHELASQMGRVKKSMPSVTLTVNDRTESEPGTVEGIIRKVAPALIGTASTALIEKATAGGASEQDGGPRLT